MIKGKGKHKSKQQEIKALIAFANKTAERNKELEEKYAEQKVDLIMLKVRYNNLRMNYDSLYYQKQQLADRTAEAEWRAYVHQVALETKEVQDLSI